VESSYFTKESIGYLLSKASRNAQTLALESNILTSETSGLIISKSAMQANSLAAQLKNKGYTPT
jgi:hypothetical protein